MSEVIVVTSGKGGVGKTTTSANVGTGLAADGQTCCTDRHRHRIAKSGCSHGAGKPDCLQSGRRGRRKVPN